MDSRFHGNDKVSLSLIRYLRDSLGMYATHEASVFLLLVFFFVL